MKDKDENKIIVRFLRKHLARSNLNLNRMISSVVFIERLIRAGLNKIIIVI